MEKIINKLTYKVIITFYIINFLFCVFLGYLTHETEKILWLFSIITLFSISAVLDEIYNFFKFNK